MSKISDDQLEQKMKNCETSFCSSISEQDYQRRILDGKTSIDQESTRSAAFAEGVDAGVASVDIEGLWQRAFEAGQLAMPDCERPPKKVKVCKITPAGVNKTIVVSEKALAAHLKMGSTLGECAGLDEQPKEQVDKHKAKPGK